MQIFHHIGDLTMGTGKFVDKLIGHLKVEGHCVLVAAKGLLLEFQHCRLKTRHFFRLSIYRYGDCIFCDGQKIHLLL